jgi:hypothetical protein
MTLGIGKVKFGVLKRATMGESRGLKRLWCVMAQGGGWHATMRSEMPKVRQWTRFGDWEAQERDTRQGKSNSRGRVKLRSEHFRVRRWAKTMDCGARERDMGWRSFFLASVSHLSSRILLSLLAMTTGM